jgi:hypothetical protein
MTAQSPSPWRRRWLRAGFVGAVAFAFAGPAAAWDAAPVSSTATVVDPAAPNLTASVAVFGPAVLGPGVPLVTSVEIANLSVEQTDDLTLRLSLTRKPLTTREHVTAFLDNTARYRSRTVDERAIAPIPMGQSVRATLTASADDLALPSNRWGVYGVSVYLVEGGASRLIDTMVFTWADADIPNLPLAVVATASGSDARVSSLLAAADHPSVTLLVDPMAVRGVAGAAEEVSTREAYRVPGGNLDLASLAHAQNLTILEFALARSAADVPRNLQGLPWVGILPILDEPTLQLAYDTGAVAALIEPRFGAQLPLINSNAPGLPPPVADATLASSGDTIALMIPDAGLSELLAQYRPHHPATPARVVAEAALIAAQGDGTQPVIVAAGSSWVVDGTRTSPVINELFNAPWITPVSLASVLSDTRRGTASVSGAEPSEADLDRSSVEAIEARLTKLEHLAATVDSPTTVIDGPSAAMLNVASLDARAAQEDRIGAVQEVLEDVDVMLESVSITSGSALNLVSATGNVPVTIRNNLDVASTVTVRMTANSPNIRITDSPVVTIPPHSEITALVPVSAVSSANVTVRLSLRNADDEVIGTPRAVDVRVRADWGNAATAVFTVALVLLLVAGLVRTVRRGRKDTRTGPGEVAALAAPRLSEPSHE